MKNVHASKKTGQKNTTFHLIRTCPFCTSSRITFVAGDDDGPYATVKCSHCEAEGPHVRARVWESSAVTDQIRQEEAVHAWNLIWDNMTPRAPYVLVDREGNEVAPRKPARRRPAKAKSTVGLRAPEPVAPQPARFFTCKCPSDKHGELTGCSGTGSSMTEGLCAFCVAEHRKTEHAVQVVTAPKALNGTNGHNGHHTNGVL